MRVVTYIEKIPEKTTEERKAYRFRRIEFPELMSLSAGKTIDITIDNDVISSEHESRNVLYIREPRVDFDDGLVFV
jgi:hypothetical protein